MSIMDAKLEFYDAQALAGSTAATFAGNTIDLGPAKDWNGTAINPNTGRGNPVYIHARVGTAGAGESATATLAVFLQHGATNSPASFSNLMNMNLAGSASMTLNKLTAGKLVYSGAIPVNCKRYLRVKSTIGGGTITGGTLDVWMDAANIATKME
jgi:hypothetical protein